jgi:hypothetical protein
MKILVRQDKRGAKARKEILQKPFFLNILAATMRLLCFIPESGRFSPCFMLLKVVGPGGEE